MKNKDFVDRSRCSLSFCLSDYAIAFSRGFVHRKHKPKIAAQFSGFLFLSAYQNKF
jgi:hypothetical protein